MKTPWVSVTGVTDGQNGTTAIVDGQLEYTPNADFNGEDSISYTLTDAYGGQTTQTVAMTVNPVNDGPRLSMVSEWGSDMLKGQVLSEESLGGTGFPQESFTLGFWVKADFTQLDWRTNIFDRWSMERTHFFARFYENGEGEHGIQIALQEEGQTSYTLHKVIKLEEGEVINNEWNQIVLEWEKDSAFRVYSNGEVVYSYIEGEGLGISPMGQEFTVNGNSGLFELSAMTLFETALEESAIASLYHDGVPGGEVDDLLSQWRTDEDSPLVVSPGAWYSDIEGDAVSLTGVTDGENGRTVIVEGQLEYMPEPDFHGTDRMSYTLSDGNGGETSKSVTVLVHAVNDAPVGTVRTASTEEDSPITLDVAGMATDVEGDVVSVTGASVEVHDVPVEVGIQVATDYYVAEGTILTTEQAAAFYEPATFVVLVDGEEVGRDVASGEMMRNIHTYSTAGVSWSRFVYTTSQEVAPSRISVRMLNDYTIPHKYITKQPIHEGIKI